MVVVSAGGPGILGENIKQVKEINCARRILLPPGVFFLRILWRLFRK
jgi:hypothetical protein